MADPMPANYVFLPWVRQGAASAIEAPDMSASQPGIVSVAVSLRINDAHDIVRRVRLYGPGDVTGIDPQQIIRTEPRHLATDFEPNYFPAVEFDRPDFPWLFTPAKADAAGRLRPWLCLVVVRKQDGVTLTTDRNLPLPVLAIEAPARPERELPDLSESWAWAHAQVAGSRPDEAALKKSLAGDPALTLSRLLCPRRLDPLTDYLACLVPAFELGCKAGLGLPIGAADEGALNPAWTSGAQSPPQVSLPVYYHWSFRTGTGGDFEALVGRLEARDSSDMPPEVGKLRLDISRPGFRISPAPPAGAALDLEGALRLLGAPAADWPDDGSRRTFQDALQPILDAPWLALEKEGEEPLLAPPIYGCWQAARHRVNAAPEPPAASTWLDDLNLDPRHRVAAALGTRVVQTRQEQLMASAWEQLGEIERINQMRRQAQLGRAVNGIYYARHFSRFSDEALLKVVAPAQSRLVVGSEGTRAMLSHRISQSAVPVGSVSAPLRRLTTPRGTISTRFRAGPAAPIAFMAKLETAIVVQPAKPEAGLVTLDRVVDAQAGVSAAEMAQTVRFERASAALDTAPQLGDFTVAAEGSVPQRCLLDFTGQPPFDSADAQAFRGAAKGHLAYLERVFAPRKTGAEQRLNLFGTAFDIKGKLLHSINPERTVTARVNASLALGGGPGISGDALEPILDAPEFPQPMYEALRDLSQDFLFPGLGHVPPNTVTLLETNPRLVESFLVGLSAEMGRELLWRNYPTDQRGTYFRHFWDTSAGSDEPDIDGIDTWGDRRLGRNAGAGEQLVLLIRGELLQRYPNAVIYAVRAVKTGTRLDLSRDPAQERHPLFRGTLKPDVTFLGFALTQAEAIADPGWFFVIQEQPTEPRFGMDAPDFSKPLPELTSWNQLSWRHLAATEEALKALSHASIKTALPAIDGVEWGGRNAAHQAYITLQRPVRIAIHASQMIKQG